MWVASFGYLHIFIHFRHKDATHIYCIIYSMSCYVLCLSVVVFVQFLVCAGSPVPSMATESVKGQGKHCLEYKLAS